MSDCGERVATVIAPLQPLPFFDSVISEDKI